jgi:hypothetical protein
MKSSWAVICSLRTSTTSFSAAKSVLKIVTVVHFRDSDKRRKSGFDETLGFPTLLTKPACCFPIRWFDHLANVAFKSNGMTNAFMFPTQAGLGMAISRSTPHGIITEGTMMEITNDQAPLRILHVAGQAFCHREAARCASGSLLTRIAGPFIRDKQ